MRVRIAVAASAVALAAAPAVHAAGRPAHGTWQQLVNCAITSYDLTSKHMTCLGSSLWRGTFSGLTHYRVDATYDLLTGDGHGTIDETFHGRTAGGRNGTLRFLESFTATGSTQAMHIDARAVSGTAGLTGSRATLTFDGVDNVLTGHGSYAGNWYPGAVR